jgi:hypothetical protein
MTTRRLPNRSNCCVYTSEKVADHRLCTVRCELAAKTSPGAIRLAGWDNFAMAFINCFAPADQDVSCLIGN